MYIPDDRESGQNRRVHDRWKMHHAGISADDFINYLCRPVSPLSEPALDTRLLDFFSVDSTVVFFLS